MKAYLKFNLSDEDDRYNYLCAINAVKYKLYIDGLYQEVFRSFLKYGYPEDIHTPEDMLNALIDKYHKYHKEALENDDI